MNSSFKTFTDENIKHSASKRIQININQIATNIVCYFRCVACSDKCLALQALQLKWACRLNTVKLCPSCPVFKLFSVQLSALLNLTGTAQPMTDKQDTQHSNSTLPTLCYHLCSLLKLLPLLSCPSFPSFLFTFSWQTPKFVTSLFPLFHLCWVFFCLLPCLQPICPCLHIHVKRDTLSVSRGCQK